MTDRPAVAPDQAGPTPRYAWLPHFYLICTMLFFAGAIVVGRAIREDVPPMGLVFWRNVFALILLLPFVAQALRAEWYLMVRHWRLMVVIGFFNAIGQALVYIGLHTTTAVAGAVINATQPVLIVVLAWLMIREMLSRRQGIGLAIALLGVLVIVARGNLDHLLSLQFVIGDIWIELAMISWSVYQVLIKRVPREMSPFVLLFILTFTGMVGLAPFYIGELLLTDWRVEFNLVTVLTIGYATIFVQILAVVCLNLGIAYLGPSRSGAFFYLMPVFAGIMAIFLLGETLEVYHLVALALVFSGVYFSGRRR